MFRGFLKQQLNPDSLNALEALSRNSDFWARAFNAVGPDYDYTLIEQTPDGRGHYSDIGKLPNHPTFSNESIYAKYYPELAGQWSETSEGRQMFTEGVGRAGDKAYEQFMEKEYFPNVEPGAVFKKVLQNIKRKK